MKTRLYIQTILWTAEYPVRAVVLKQNILSKVQSGLLKDSKLGK